MEHGAQPSRASPTAAHAHGHCWQRGGHGSHAAIHFPDNEVTVVILIVIGILLLAASKGDACYNSFLPDNGNQEFLVNAVLQAYNTAVFRQMGGNTGNSIHKVIGF